MTVGALMYRMSTPPDWGLKDSGQEAGDPAAGPLHIGLRLDLRRLLRGAGPRNHAQKAADRTPKDATEE